MLNSHIFLVGFMGVGKTTSGKKLAHLLNSQFIDLDELFVEQEGLSIADFFKLYNEDQFREKERNLLHSLSKEAPAIVATGGGTPCFFDNMDWMNENGITIYLQMPAPALAQRLANSKRHKRPLIKDLDESEILQFIEERMKIRHPFYVKSKYHINAMDINLEKLREQIGL